ncbi:energy transducer TonB [Pelagicoccus sp. SDUM812002]|uniref:energy transducer TonB n=1 Tax=Pelagicoccus sp. SDUM812002 TaxID=3041266 RepID=UPI00280CDB1F|nr:energy transducer TonB [Pelagicoccus sp. SDUM812002]MDQ8185264.1 energy transducer TonB [Pelagicoccus sp. SDUM812002]
MRSAAEAVKAVTILQYLEEGEIEAGQLGEVHALSDVSEKPKLLTPIVVEYSDDLRARYGSRQDRARRHCHFSGRTTAVCYSGKQESRTHRKVVVEFTLMAEGTVRDARPLNSTYSAFEKPAVAYILQSLWQTAVKNGKPVACKVRIPITSAPRACLYLQGWQGGEVGFF